ncbi:8664_t:CDS:2 [Entrophospora sp. SA101]|nr:8664_t:CDS:2 [Entrophospora sp. SA101]
MSELRNQQSAYSYPSPAQTITKADITLREILDTYREDNDLLKLILATKTEEDKANSHFSNTTPTSATTHFSPPPSANNHNSNHVHDHINTSQKPSLTLSIPSFPIISSSPTVMHSHHSFSNPNSSVEHPHSASSLTHRHSFYSQSPTSAVGSKRTRPSENEVDHEYVMEAIRAKVQRNQEHPAKKFMNVLKPRSASMPVPPINNNSPTTSSSHHSTQQNTQTSSPVDPSQSHSPIPPPQLPPINVHSPGLNQDSKA